MIDVFFLFEIAVVLLIVVKVELWLRDRMRLNIWNVRPAPRGAKDSGVDWTSIDWKRMGEHRRRFDEAQRGER